MYILSQQDSNGATPLHYAVEADSLEAVEVLMRRPEVIMIENKSSNTEIFIEIPSQGC